MSWTDDKIEALRQLWAQSLSAAQVARALNARFAGSRLTRNAVIGKAGRLKLPPHSYTTKRLQQKLAAPRGSKVKGNPTGYVPKARKPRPNNLMAVNIERRAQALVFGETRVKPAYIIIGSGDGTSVVEKPPGQSPRIAIKARAWTPLDGSEPVPLLNLRSGCCKWPVDVPEATEAHFCGLQAKGTYCKAHAKLSQGQGTPSERNAAKIPGKVAA